MLPRKILNFVSSEIRFPAFWGSLTLFYYCFEHFYTFYQTFYSVKGRAAAPSPRFHIIRSVCKKRMEQVTTRQNWRYAIFPTLPPPIIATSRLFTFKLFSNPPPPPFIAISLLFGTGECRRRKKAIIIQLFLYPFSSTCFTFEIFSLWLNFVYSPRFKRVHPRVNCSEQLRVARRRTSPVSVFRFFYVYVTHFRSLFLQPAVFFIDFLVPSIQVNDSQYHEGYYTKMEEAIPLSW